MVSVVAALMAAMMVTAGPAKADVSFGGGSSGVDVDVDVGDGFFDVGNDGFGFDVGDGIRRFDVGDGIRFVDVGDDFDDDDDDDDRFTNRVFFSQSNSVLDNFRPGGISIS